MITYQYLSTLLPIDILISLQIRKKKTRNKNINILWALHFVFTFKAGVFSSFPEF